MFQTMTYEHLFLLCLAIFAIAFLYSSVGHAGASGYIAVMTLAGLSPAFIKPTALILNILVACLGSWQFYRAGHFSWSLFWPFALLAIPLAFLGGYINLPIHVFKILVGVILIFSAFRFVIGPQEDREPHKASLGKSLAVGGGLGFLAGLTGTGGGIFLTPVLIFARWARTKTASATSAVFILTNSASGLIGNITSTKHLPSLVIPLAAAVISGGAIGSYLGSHRFAPVVIKRFLAMVLTIAGAKLIFT
jgi:uncharacterized membrane protein YfcA